MKNDLEKIIKQQADEIKTLKQHIKQLNRKLAYIERISKQALNKHHLVAENIQTLKHKLGER